jgi:hypothetical protein
MSTLGICVHCIHVSLESLVPLSDPCSHYSITTELILTLPRIVERNISSALIMEDDIDWDIRIKSQMKQFAQAVRLLIQPLPAADDLFLDPTYPRPSSDQAHTDFYVDEHSVSRPKDSPYGDLARWDVLWLGHCGCRFPRPSDINSPLARVVLPNDTTVPAKHHLDMEFGNNELLMQYPAHTRVVSRARVHTCSLAYAVSQPGARRLLYELAVHEMSDPTDLMLRYVCDGVQGRQMGTCFTVQPQLLQHHRPLGPRAGFSDISDHGGGYNDRAVTSNIRWSSRLNLPRLIEGRHDYIDLFKDDERGE